MSLIEALDLHPGDVVALVGGGGKTSLGYRLVREAAARGWRPLFTVTTKIYPPDLPPHQWVAGPALPDGKLSGVTFDQVDALRVHDLVVVEADGSAGRPLKFPAAHEPVIPPCTTVVLAVAGASAVGQPLSSDWVHRAAPAVEFLGQTMVTPAVVARILTEVATRGRPISARVVPVLNQADSPERLASARAVGSELLRLGAPLVLLTAAQSEPPVVERMVAGGD